MANSNFPPNYAKDRGWTPDDLGRSTVVDLLVDNSTVVLNALRGIGSVSGVPFLGDAAGIALRIMNMMKEVRNNRDAFMELAQDVCGLVYTILIECQEMAQNRQEVPQRVQNHIAKLTSNLRDIEGFAEKKLKRNGIQKLINHSKDLEQIARYREMLRQSLDIFGIQTNISIQQNLHHIVVNIDQQRADLYVDRLRHTEAEQRLKQEQAAQHEELKATLLRQAEQDRLQKEEHQAQIAKLQSDQLRQEQERLAKEDKAARREAIRAALHRKAHDLRAQEDQERIAKGKEEALRDELKSERLKQAERDRRAEAKAEQLRKSKEDRATRMEIRRIQEQDLLEELDEEAAIEEARIRKEAKRQRAKANEERLRFESERIKQEQAAQRRAHPRSKSDVHRLSADVEKLRLQQEYDQPAYPTYAQSPHNYPYLMPPPGPYGYAPYSISAPYLAAPPPNPYLGGGYASISLNNINGSTISLGNSAPPSPVVYNNINSGNVTTTIISGCYNKP